jgi:hypothetical protein
MGNAPSSDEATETAEQKDSFVWSLIERLWHKDVSGIFNHAGFVPFPISVDDAVVLPVILDESEDRSNMILPRDIWLLLFEYVESPRVLGRLASCCKVYRRLVLQADKRWRHWAKQFHPYYMGRADIFRDRQLVAWVCRAFLGDSLLPADLDVWLLVPPLPVVRVLVASLGEVASGKSNLIARFVRDKFIGDSNRLSLALEQQTASKIVSMIFVFVFCFCLCLFRFKFPMDLVACETCK